MKGFYSFGMHCYVWLMLLFIPLSCSVKDDDNIQVPNSCTITVINQNGVFCLEITKVKGSRELEARVSGELTSYGRARGYELSTNEKYETIYVPAEKERTDRERSLYCKELVKNGNLIPLFSVNELNEKMSNQRAHLIFTTEGGKEIAKYKLERVEFTGTIEFYRSYDQMIKDQMSADLSLTTVNLRSPLDCEVTFIPYIDIFDDDDIKVSLSINGLTLSIDGLSL